MRAFGKNLCPQGGRIGFHVFRAVVQVWAKWGGHLWSLSETSFGTFAENAECAISKIEVTEIGQRLRRIAMDLAQLPETHTDYSERLSKAQKELQAISFQLRRIS
jgi:hypothetical protein